MHFFNRATVLTLCLAVTGCTVERTPNRFEGTARDEWVRSYTLDQGGEVQINNRGPVDVEGVDGNTVEVRVERIAHGATDAAAAEIVPRIEIREEVSPARVMVRTDGLAGIIVGVRVETSYHVRVPRTATVRVRGVDNVSVKGISGCVIANGVNGPVTAENLSGSVEVRSVNGDATVALAALGGDLVDIRSVNGGVNLTLPANANANLNALVVNGKIDTGDLKFEPFGEQNERRVRGRINAGGVPIEISRHTRKLGREPRVTEDKATRCMGTKPATAAVSLGGRVTLLG